MISCKKGKKVKKSGKNYSNSLSSTDERFFAMERKELEQVIGEAIDIVLKDKAEKEKIRLEAIEAEIRLLEKELNDDVGTSSGKKVVKRKRVSKKR